MPDDHEPPHEWIEVGLRRWCVECGSFQIYRNTKWADALVGEYPAYSPTDMSKHED